MNHIDLVHNAPTSGFKHTEKSKTKSHNANGEPLLGEKIFYL